MKKNLLTLSLLGCTLGAIAQPTLTADNCRPVVGDQYVYHVNSSYSGDGGAAGANQVWDFSDATDITDMQITYMDCSEAPDCAENPGANLISHQDNGDAYIYFITDNAKTSIKGMATMQQGVKVVISYSDPEDYTHFPFTFNDEYTDAMASTVSGTGLDIDRTGNITVTADGYGTLITPAGTYNNVLRIFRNEVYQDDIDMGGGNVQTIHYESKLYTWYQPGNNEFLLNITFLTADGATMSSILEYTTQDPAAVKTLSPMQHSLQVFPNPATDQVNLNFNSGEIKVQSVCLTDILGKVITRIPANDQTGVQQYTLDLTHLANNIYFIQLQTSAGVISRKVQVLK